MSDAKPPSMTCDCLDNIVFGPASTIEALGRPTEPPDARDVVIVTRDLNGATAQAPWKYS